MEIQKPTQTTLGRRLALAPVWLLLAVVIVLAGMFVAGGMYRISAWYLVELIPPVIGLATLVVTVIAGIIRRKLSRAMKTNLLAGVLALLPVIAVFIPVAYPASLENTTPAATVRLPADVPLQVAWGGDSLKTNYHAVTPDQRWAYDLLVAPSANGSSRLEDYGCYGVPILAPAEGLVVDAHDGEPDEVPGVVSNNTTAPTGNHVFIQIESGTYLVIAHMKTGSLQVQTGDRVTEGQVIGQCGNSGNTSEPHIHIHHQRQDPTVFPLNFAEGLPLYFRDHDGPAMPVGGFEMSGDMVILLGDTVQHTGK